MPQIPTYQPLQVQSNRLSPGSVAIPTAPGGVRASADVFGGWEGSAALSKAASTWMEAGAAFEASRKETVYQSEKVSARLKMAEFEKGLIQRSDWDKFEPEFDGVVSGIWKDYEERIQDPDVLQALKVNLTTRALQRSSAVSKLARDKEIEWGQGAYAGRQAEYLNLFASTQDPAERTRIVDDARKDIRATIGAGYIKPEKGVADLGKFLERTSVQMAQEVIRAAPDQFNPDAFPFLSPEHRISLGDQAQRRVEGNERERVRQEEKAEKLQEKQLKEWRDNNARALWVRQGKGLTLPEVDEAIARRLIDLDEGKALKRALQSDDGPEDEDVKSHLYIAVQEGSAGKSDILSAYTRGLISGKTKDKYLENYFSLQKADALEKRPEYKDAEKHIHNNLKSTGPMSQFDTDEFPRIEAAMDDFKAQVKKGTPILEARDDVVKRFRVSDPGVMALPKPLFGTRDDPASAFRETEKAFQENRIDWQTYRREILNIKRLQETLDRNAEPGAQSAEQRKKKIKGRGD